MTDQPIPKPARRRAATKAAMTSQAKHPRRASGAPPTDLDPPAADRPAAADEPGQETIPLPDPATMPDPGSAAAGLAAPAAVDVAAPPPARPAATTVPIHGTGSVDRVEVDLLEFERGAIGGVRAGDVAARQAVVGGIAAGHASVEIGLVGGIAARDVTVQQGAVRGVVAQHVHVEQAVVRSVVANQVTTGPTTAILVAVARTIDGEARVLLDWRGGLALGGALGAFLALIALARRRG